MNRLYGAVGGCGCLLLLLVTAATLVDDTQAQNSRVECTEGSDWYNGCNHCRCISGLQACTKRRCPHGLMPLAGPQCSEGSSWLQDGCNWCTCQGRSAVCTRRACIGAHAFGRSVTSAIAPTNSTDGPSVPTDGEECRYVGEEHRWRVSCNWCRCTSTGVAMCTRRGCSPAISTRLEGTKECEGSPQWRRDCNWCRCMEGKASCTRRACPVRPSDVSDHAPSVTADSAPVSADSDVVPSAVSAVIGPDAPTEDEERQECSESGRWRSECNWCHCINGRAACTKRHCTPALIQRVSGTRDCDGSVSWLQDGCNWCTCSPETGRAACTQRACFHLSNHAAGSRAADAAVQATAATVEGECKDGSVWSDQCNSCSCRGGFALCTRRACPPREFEETCEENSRWKKDCNWCSCTAGKPSCSRRACPPPATAAVSPLRTGLGVAEPQCTEGSRWRMDACNWCTCNNGVGACTAMACAGEAPADEEDCTPGSSWRSGCNRCTCMDSGHARCTKRLCPSAADSGAADEVAEEAPVTEVTTREPQCGEGSRWRRDGCNWCTCSNGIGACTMRACIQEAAAEEQDCSPGSWWRVDCNRCSCSDSGHGRCTKRLCPPRSVTSNSNKPQVEEQPLPPHMRPQIEERPRQRPQIEELPSHMRPQIEERPRPVHPIGEVPPHMRPQIEEGSPIEAALGLPRDDRVCVEGSSYFDGCNWCNCARNGVAQCTQKFCFASAPLQCKGDAQWKHECNWCRCENDTPVCTEKACLPDLTELPQDAECEVGAEFLIDCNWCSCSSDGKRFCTKKLCSNDGNYTAEVQCEGEARFKDKHNCNWCTCINGTAACTEKLCITAPNQEEPQPDEEEPTETQTPPTEGREEASCLDGSTWVEECNLCQCSGGVARCTRRACLPETQPPPPGPPSVNRCLQPAESGPCFASLRRFRFNSEKNRCEPFLYGGCGGNDNRFSSSEDCFNTCGGEPPVNDPQCDRQRCPELRHIAFMAAKGCEPHYEEGACCPTSYTCASTSIEPVPVGSCLYKGHVYANGDDVDVGHECSSCTCSSGTLSCANIECPSLFTRPQPNCRNIYAPGTCCEVDTVCQPLPVVGEEAPDTAVVRDDVATCEVDGKSYLDGDKISPGDYPCRQCVCTANYTGPFGPGCSDINCGYDFRYQNRIDNGCVPLYFKNRCCPVSFICPGDSEVAEEQTPVSGDEPIEGEACSFGDVTLSVGQALATTKENINCSCQTPPSVTCVRTS